MNMWLTLIIAIVISVAVGFLNGIIIYDFQVPPMIATLGMQTPRPWTKFPALYKKTIRTPYRKGSALWL